MLAQGYSVLTIEGGEEITASGTLCWSGEDVEWETPNAAEQIHGGLSPSPLMQRPRMRCQIPSRQVPRGV